MPTVPEELCHYITHEQVWREVIRRNKPIWFYVVAQIAPGLGYEPRKCVMDTQGIISPRFYGLYKEYGQHISYFPNYFTAWAYALRLNRGLGLRS